ncbi:hypothetical protein AcV5_004951 [Taiwanofungus camphoratus]|nr:hypothetical protein AcV5_004951 [Antrodia cinnamomea]
MGEQSTNYLYRRKTSSSYSSLIGGLWVVWVCKYCREWFDKISYFLRLLSHFTLESAGPHRSLSPCSRSCFTLLRRLRVPVVLASFTRLDWVLHSEYYSYVDLGFNLDDIYKHLHTFQNCKYGHASTDGQMEGANSSHSTSRYLSIKTSSIQEEG